MTRTSGPQSRRLEQQALERLKKRRALATQAVAYVLVNVANWVTWALTGAGYPWPVWLALLWGVALAVYAWDAMFRRPITPAKIDQEIERLEGGHG